MESYLQRLEQLGIDPNFWCSIEYAEKAGLRGSEVMTRNGLAFSVKDLAEGWDVFPPLGPSSLDGHSKIWSDFPDFPGEALGYTPHFLDYEYIYDPRAFLTMEGGEWMTFL